jgi:hypothetical protein
MPRDRRPAVVLVVAILNMFFGGMNLLGTLCAVPVLVLLVNLPMPTPPGNIWMGMYDSLEKRIPYLPAIMVGALLFGLAMNIALLASGIGLWKMRPWARRLAIAYAVVALLNVVVGLVVNLVWLNPVMADWQEDFVAKQTNPNAPPPPIIFGPKMQTAMSVFGTAFGSIYPTALLIILFLPRVRTAFAAVGSPPVLEEEELPEVLDASSPISERREWKT